MGSPTRVRGTMLWFNETKDLGRCARTRATESTCPEQPSWQERNLSAVVADGQWSSNAARKASADSHSFPTRIRDGRDCAAAGKELWRWPRGNRRPLPSSSASEG